MSIHKGTFIKLKEILTNRKRKRLYKKGFKPSSVALINHIHNGDIHLLFTMRSQNVRHHQQQVSFPGGTKEKGEGLLRCVIRETFEELNIHIEKDDLIGPLDDTITISGYRITPFVIFVRREGIMDRIRINNEISEVINIPLKYLLMHPFRVENMQFGKKKVTQYFYKYEGYIIWGATGRILKQYLEILNLSLQQIYFPEKVKIHMRH